MLEAEDFMLLFVEGDLALAVLVASSAECGIVVFLLDDEHSRERLKVVIRLV